MIYLKNIYKSYGDHEVLKDINLHIAPGEFTLLLGKSGSGKSTLLNLLGLIDEPSAGSYFFGGTDAFALDMAGRSAFRGQNFGFIFQRYNLISKLSVRENILLAASFAPCGLDKNQANTAAQKLLEQLQIAHLADKSAALCSGGEQQRASIARALITRANLLLADEPTGALDSANAAALMDELAALHAAGTSIVMVTHDESLVRYATRVIRLKDGRIISDERGPKSPVSATPVGVCDTAAATKSAVLSPISASPVGVCKTAKKQSLDFAAQSFAAETSPTPSPADTADAAAPAASKSLCGAGKFLFAMALRNLRAHKLRSGLSALGIIIACFAIVATIALGEGAKADVLEQISFLGQNTIIVQKGLRAGGDDAQNLRDLSASDMAVLRAMPFVQDVSTQSALGEQKASAKARSVDLFVTGVLPNYLQIKSKKLAAGRFISPLESERASAVCVLSEGAARELFGSPEAAIGEQILLRGGLLRVVGVLAASRMSDGFDLELFMSTNALAARFSGDFGIGRFYVILRPEAPSKRAEELIKTAFKLLGGSVITYNLDAVRQTITASAERLGALIIAIAAIAMLVGGVGVANIMLVAIKERSQEIGIQLAIGAAPGVIAAGFLLEALLLAASGAAVGCVCASALAVGLSALGVRMILTPLAFALGLGLSLLCGLVFGYFPARFAGRLTPAECLLQH